MYENQFGPWKAFEVVVSVPIAELEDLVHCRYLKLDKIVYMAHNPAPFRKQFQENCRSVDLLLTQLRRNNWKE